MGAHRDKNQVLSSCSSDDDNDSNPPGNKKQHAEKTKSFASNESEEEHSSKSRRRHRSTSSNDSDERKKKYDRKKIKVDESESKSVSRNKNRSYLSERERYKDSKQEKSQDDGCRNKSYDRDRSSTRNRRHYDNKKEEMDKKVADRQRTTSRDHRDRRSGHGDKRSEYKRNQNSRDNDRERDYKERSNHYKNSRGRRSRSTSFDHANAKWGKNDEPSKSEKGPVEKEKPNFSLSGKLTEETNTYKGVVVKYSEPPEARKPRRRWRLYPFKGEKALQTLYIHRESAYLIGRERKVVDLPVDHPSCSKQHAALQYRLVPFTRDDGSAGKRVRPYIIDLESANGTSINNKKIEPKKYVELFEKDVIKFGFSSREYVLLHENSKDESMDDDVKQEEEELPIKEEPKSEMDV